jgi:hypothetical protein
MSKILSAKHLAALAAGQEARSWAWDAAMERRHAIFAARAKAVREARLAVGGRPLTADELDQILEPEPRRVDSRRHGRPRKGVSSAEMILAAVFILIVLAAAWLNSDRPGPFWRRPADAGARP